jgi:eukaryotic translation initiation factor 2C
MYVGIDLSHDALDSEMRRSTVAVVASADEIPNRYFKELYVQERPPGVRNESIELVIDLKDIMKSLIRQYDHYREGPPKAIIIFRDGISTSEFGSVFKSELTAIREACVELSPVYRPALTYIVVNKRHHTRFFQPDLQKNIPAGTVVDSPDVTHPLTFSFFLNSHHVEKVTNV